MATIADAYVQVIPSAEGISGKLTQALGGEAQAAGERAGSTIGGQIASFASKAIVALGVGKMISDAITSGMDFETTMAKASTLFAGTGEEFAALQSEILDLSSTYGIAATEFAEAAYSAESASVPMGNLGGMLEASAQLATAGFTDMDTALSATAKTMNAYGMMSDDVAETQANMERVQRVLIQTQNKGITTVGELGASLAQVTPTAAAFGVSFEQVGAALAGMTAQGTPTAQATTQLNSLLAELGKSGTTAANNLAQAAEGTEYAGMSFNEMMDAGADLNDVLSMLGGLAEENGVAMVDMFSSIEAGKAAMTISESDFVGNMEAMATEADVVGEAFEKMADTAKFKMDTLKMTMKNIGIKAFASTADVLSGALEGVSTVLDIIMPSLESMGSALKNLMGTAGQVAGDLLGMGEGFSLAEAAGSGLALIIDGITMALQLLSGDTSVIDTLCESIVNGIPALQAKGAEIITGILDGIMQFLPTLLTTGVEIITSIATGIMENLPQMATTAGEMISSLVSFIMESLPELLAAGVELVVNLAQGFVQNIPELLTAAAGAIIDLVAEIAAHLPDLLESGISLIGELASGLIKAIPDLVAKIPEIIQGIVNKFGEYDWLSLGGSIIDGIASGIVSFGSNLITSILSICGDAFDAVKAFFGIKSPSKLMEEEIGRWIPPGIAVGIEKNMSPVRVAMKDLALNTAASFNGGVYRTENQRDDRIDILVALLMKYLPECAERVRIDGDSILSSMDRRMGMLYA